VVSPPPWPERPSYAQDFDEFWLCAYHVPPDPWPDNPPTAEEFAALYGPVGTIWTYSAQQLLNRLTVTGAGQAATSLANRLLSRLKGLKLPPFHTLSWRNEGFAALYNEEFRMRWIHCTVHGKLGSNEEVAHTFNLRTQPAPDVDQTPANMATLAGQIRDKWQAFLTTALPGGLPAVQNYLSGNLVYDEVRCAYLEQTVAGINPKGVKDPAKRPNWIVKTQYAPFNQATAKGTGSTSADLPWEVAMCLSLNTNVRGRSFRGRSYLGPLSNGVMDPNGLFRAQIANGIAGAFGSVFLAGVNSTAGAQFQVISRTHLTGAPIQGLRVGVVPDSQRGRRRSQLEVFSQVWGQAVGALPPAS
jgi:hypothetical protein